MDFKKIILRSCKIKLEYLSFGFEVKSEISGNRRFEGDNQIRIDMEDSLVVVQWEGICLQSQSGSGPAWWNSFESLTRSGVESHLYMVAVQGLQTCLLPAPLISLVRIISQGQTLPDITSLPHSHSENRERERATPHYSRQNWYLQLQRW